MSSGESATTVTTITEAQLPSLPRQRGAIAFVVDANPPGLYIHNGTTWRVFSTDAAAPTAQVVRMIYTARLFTPTVTTAAIDTELDNIAAAGFNTVGLGLTNNGNGVAWQNPHFLPGYTAMRDASIVTPAFDAVQYFIDGAHSRNLKIYAWIELIYAGASPIHTQWNAGTPSNQYNHFSKGYRNYVNSYLTEMLLLYPGFDGVELGEAFNWSTTWGNGGAGVWEAVYAAQMAGRVYTTDHTAFTTVGYVANGGDDAIRDWMTQSATDFLAGMVETIQAVNRRDGIDRPVGYYLNNANAWAVQTGERGQQWVNSGVVDYINVPIYGDAFSTLNLQRAAHGGTDPNGVVMQEVKNDSLVMVSFNNYLDSLARPLTASELTVKLDALYAEAPTAGIAVYFYAGSSTTWLDANQVAAFAAWFAAHP